MDLDANVLRSPSHPPYHAAFNVEYQPLNRSNSQLTYSLKKTFTKKKSSQKHTGSCDTGAEFRKYTGYTRYSYE